MARDELLPGPGIEIAQNFHGKIYVSASELKDRVTELEAKVDGLVNMVDWIGRRFPDVIQDYVRFHHVKARMDTATKRT